MGLESSKEKTGFFKRLFGKKKETPREPQLPKVCFTDSDVPLPPPPPIPKSKSSPKLEIEKNDKLSKKESKKESEIEKSDNSGNDAKIEKQRDNQHDNHEKYISYKSDTKPDTKLDTTDAENKLVDGKDAYTKAAGSEGTINKFTNSEGTISEGLISKDNKHDSKDDQNDPEDLHVFAKDPDEKSKVISDAKPGAKTRKGPGSANEFKLKTASIQNKLDEVKRKADDLKKRKKELADRERKVALEESRIKKESEDLKTRSEDLFSQIKAAEHDFRLKESESKKLGSKIEHAQALIAEAKKCSAMLENLRLKEKALDAKELKLKKEEASVAVHFKDLHNEVERFRTEKVKKLKEIEDKEKALKELESRLRSAEEKYNIRDSMDNGPEFTRFEAAARVRLLKKYPGIGQDQLKKRVSVLWQRYRGK